MDKFSTKSLLALGECYVYALVDPRTNKIFYIGKGTGNRVFAHELESLKSPDSVKLKLNTIAEIKEAGLEVKKLIINWNLSEAEAFASEASLINLMRFLEGSLTNIVSGHHSASVMTVEDFDKIYGAEELKKEDIKHNLIYLKINKKYRTDLTEKELYDIVRGTWSANINHAKRADYVCAVYNSLIVAVYKPSAWYIHKDMPTKMIRPDLTSADDRIFFESLDYTSLDSDGAFYLGKSISNLIQQQAQNPITYSYK